MLNMPRTPIVYALMPLVIIVDTSISNYPNCKLTIEGLDYRGNISTTRSGRTCQRWDSQTPHRQNFFTFLLAPSIHENFCRNPKPNDEPTPWCYTTDPEVRYDFCEIPVCECRDTLDGTAYSGTVSHTIFENKCLRWDSLNSSSSFYHDIQNMKGGTSSHENYCRNPGNKTAPWCFVESIDLKWEYCDIPFCIRGSSECLSNPRGLDYFGTEARTIDNIECQRWDKQEPHAHPFSTEFMGLPVSEHNNYCRNPDSRDRPWCFTVNSSVVFQYCNVSNCKVENCKKTIAGTEYRGTQSVTRSGIPCQRWDSTFPHLPYISFSQETRSKHENYCRNVHYELYPWCYTMNPDVRWEYCDIPLCQNRMVTYPNCKLSIQGMEYRGNFTITISGKICQRWDIQTPHIHDYASSLLGGASIHENFCRNPKFRDQPTPWCFTTDPGIRSEACYVPFCECRGSVKGKDYFGRAFHTINGNPCLRWDSLSLQNPEYAAILNLKGNISSHENYCRNPDGKSAPWCFIQSDDDLWEYCDIPPCKQSNAECVNNLKGIDYLGTENKTTDNIECQRWDKQEPHTHRFSKGFLGLSASEHENYCRNPDMSDGPWCYTVNATVRFQSCNISQCEERDCKENENGENYRGKQNRTRKGIQCQRWDSNSPHVPYVIFPGETYSAHENYCRNPDNGISPWCYTVDPNVRWDYCDIPTCISDTYRCDFSKKNCILDQINTTMTKWVLTTSHKEDWALFLSKELQSSQTLLPSLRLPLLRFNKMGSCLHMKYRNSGLYLDLSTANQRLTRLPPSIDWKFIKVNIDHQIEDFQILISPIPITSTLESAIQSINVENAPCKDCFACLEDRLCIENEKFCDMRMDCPDNTDEKNCALECFNEGVYQGSRNQSKSLHRCHEGRCKFSAEAMWKPGCFINNHQDWEDCNVPSCETKSLNCDFEDDLCNWKSKQPGIMWNHHKKENSDKRVVSAENEVTIHDNNTERAILYSTPQSMAEDFGCITITYLGQNVDLQVFITQGTMYESFTPVFEQQNIDSNIFSSPSFQTPANIPYMVIIVGKYKRNLTGTLQIERISYEDGICLDKAPCRSEQFQCEDGSCISVDAFCDGIANCPSKEDELFCKHINNTECLQDMRDCLETCPSRCECQGVSFKCKSPKDVTKQARVLDLNSNTFNITHLRNFYFLVHLNISNCSLNEYSLSQICTHIHSQSLQNLDVSYNDIFTIGFDIFLKLPGLLHLNISYNSIKKLELDFLYDIPQLRYLIVSNNQIEEIVAKESNRQISSLQVLDLQNNRLRKIQSNAFYWLKAVSKIILRNNSIINTDYYFSNSMKMLFELDLSFNSIVDITANMFNGLDRLRTLILDHNRIIMLDAFSFSNLRSLRILNLAYNRIFSINRMAFENLIYLTTLNLAGNQIKSLAASRFVGLVKLNSLDLSGNEMEELKKDAFEGLEKVKRLYIHSNKLSVSKTMFQGLCNLEWLQADSYTICCAKPLTVDPSNCISPRDSISSCEQLIHVGFLAQMIWYMALFSVAGNMYVVYYRIRRKNEGNASQRTFVLNLSISDFLMGVYLFIIATADNEYRNVYGYNDRQWRSSTICTLAGLLATTSSEASVIFIFLITIERYTALKRPFASGLFRKRRFAKCTSTIAWLVALMFSSVPLIIYQDFYSRSTVCISLPLTTKKVSGWEYSTLLFIGFNLITFLAVIIGQILIFIEVKQIGRAIKKDNTKRELAVFKSLSYVVLSDTFCWIPIIVIGCVALGGVEIASDVYAWVIVLVLPINSALNPFIYTFSMIYRKKNISLSDKSNGTRNSSITKQER